MLKKEVDDEIRRDRKKNLMRIDPNTNMSAIVKSNSLKEQRLQTRTALNQRDGGNARAGQKHNTTASGTGNGSNSTQTALNYTSLRRKDPELLLEQ